MTEATTRVPSTGRALSSLVAAGILFASLGAQDAGASSSIADRVHDSLMRAHPRYPQYQVPKALAGCFDWQNSTPDEPRVRFLAVATRGRGGVGSISVGRLASNALDRCQRGKSRNEAVCECQVIDRNGRNVLEPPEEFISRFQ
ncbi:MAG: hypothetical protein QNJ67_16635 [Kiloniellales bacterium]|nr:hypothetical protein [Kiloniellales bacterium]